METVSQPDYIDGRVVRVGAKGESVSIDLSESGTLHTCTANADVAGRLSLFVNRSVIRAFGTATWTRNDSGVWELVEFSIQEFVELEDATLAEALAPFESVPSPRWPRNAAGDLDFSSRDEKNRSR